MISPNREDLLHYAWLTQGFVRQNLATVDGIPLEIVSPGHYNRDAGPDFQYAQIRLDGMSWAGAIELHLKTSDWEMHRHHYDSAYDNVVLHVVWQHDRPVTRNDGTLAPVLELQGRVSTGILARHEALVGTLGAEPPCLSVAAQVPGLVIAAMQERALVDRLRTKTALVEAVLERTSGDWEETAFRVLARAMGQHLNAEAFLAVAESLESRQLRRLADQPERLEAILMGQAGFLGESGSLTNKEDDPYRATLRSQYQFERTRLGLIQPQIQWRFARLRPAGFPTLRMAQLAAILGKAPALFDFFQNTHHAEALCVLFRTPAGQYWHHRYRFGPDGKKGSPAAGLELAHSLIINAVAPLLASYGWQRNRLAWVHRAIALLEGLPAEDNRITRLFGPAPFANAHAGQSQALIGLYRQYCEPRLCTRCQVGCHILGREAEL